MNVIALGWSPSTSHCYDAADFRGHSVHMSTPQKPSMSWPCSMHWVSDCGRHPAAAAAWGTSQAQGHQTSCTVQRTIRKGQVHTSKRLRWRKDFPKVSDYIRVRVAGGKTLYLLGKRARRWDWCSDWPSGHEDVFPSHPPKPSMAVTSSTEEEKCS